MTYNFTEIEAKWQKYWEDNKTFKAENKSEKPNLRRGDGGSFIERFSCGSSASF